MSLLGCLSGQAWAQPVRLLSRADPGLQGVTAGGSATSASQDGRFLVLLSAAPNLVGGSDLNGGQDVFLVDRQTSSVALVSHTAADPTRTGNGFSPVAAISADGSKVAFSSTSSDLVVGSDGNVIYDVFLWDRLSNATVLVSHAVGAPGTAGNLFTYPGVSLSDDGRYVTFASAATDLVTGTDANNAEDVFVYDSVTGTNTLVSHAAASASTSGNSFSNFPVVSRDGGFVGFASASTDIVSGQLEGNAGMDVFLYDRTTGTNTLVSRAAGSPTTTGNGTALSEFSLSADASFVAFDSFATDIVPGSDANSSIDVFIFDRVGGAVALVSHPTGMPTTTGNFLSEEGRISADGGSVVFVSLASDLIAGVTDGNGTFDVLRYERATDTLTLVSHADGSPTAAANGSSGTARVGDLGQQVLFTSLATDLVAGSDTNAQEDAFVYASATGAVTLVSATAAPGTAGDRASYGIALVGATADALFVSDGTDMVPGVLDSNGASDAFFRDSTAQATELLSERHGLASLSAAGVSAMPSDAAMSGDGRYVVFLNDAQEIAGTDANRAYDAFLYDRVSEGVTLLSHAAGAPTSTGNGSVFEAALSGDGRYVAFSSSATDLVPGSDVNVDQDMFLWDRVTGSTVLVSHAAGSPGTAANAGSYSPSISADGRYVAFLSNATDLVPGNDENFGFDVFLFDRQTGIVALVSHLLGDPTSAGNNLSGLAAISADGAFVAFESFASDLVGGSDANSDTDVFLWDRVQDSITLVSHADGGATTAGDQGSGRPVPSADGGFVAYQSRASDLVAGATDLNFDFDVFLFERASGSSILVSRAGSPTVTGNAFSDVASVSADGRYVAFESAATDLVPGVDPNLYLDVFLFDRVTETTVLASHADGFPTTAGNSHSEAPRITGDGSGVVFRSYATDIVPGTDANVGLDVFLFEASTGSARLVSHVPGSATTTPAGGTEIASPSFDGTYVAFVSYGPDLTPLDFNLMADAFLFGPAGAQANLSVVKVDDTDPVPPGAILGYQITVTNAGPDPADAVVSDPLPAGTTLSSVAAPPSWSCSSTSSSVSCTNPILGPGSATLDVAVVVDPGLPDGTILTNTATVVSSTPDPVAGNESDTATTTVLATADLSVANLDAPDPVSAGEMLTYAITVTNAGPVAAASVTVSDTLPGGTAFQTLAAPDGWSCTTPPVGSGGTVSCTAATVPTESADFTLAVQVDTAVPGGSVLSDTVTVTSSTSDPNPANNSGTATTTVVANADVAVSLADSPDPLAQGRPLTYLLDVANGGPSDATGVQLTLALPAELAFVSSVPGSPTCIGSAGGVSCDLGTLTPVAGQTVSVVASVVPGSQGLVSATASVTASSSDPNASNNTAAEDTTLTRPMGPDLVHGSVMVGDVRAQSGPLPDEDWYHLGQAPRASYELVVDGVSGDVYPPILERIASDATTVLQDSSPIGSGTSRSLTWESGGSSPATSEFTRVRSGGCTTGCDPDDVYRIRILETTGALARVNNSATQITVLVFQSTGDVSVAGTLWFYDAAGGLVAAQPFVIPPRAGLVLNTAVIVPGLSGSATVSSNARYGELFGKAVALETATGFTFDTPLVLRPR